MDDSGFLAVVHGKRRCPYCGAPGRRRRGSVRWADVGRWLFHGAPRPGRLSVCVHGHEWSTGSMLYLRRARPWHVVPFRLIRFLRGARRAEPAPWIHLAALALGLALGLLADWWLGWPWWAFVLGVPFLVWCLFLATAAPTIWRSIRLWGWRVTVVEVFGSGEGWARHHRLSSLVAAGRAVAYGLPPEMGGRRDLRGSGTSRDQVTSVTLGHGDPSAGPYVEVGFHTRPMRDQELEMLGLRDRLGEPVPDPALLGAEWEPCRIPVDGVPIEFRRLQRDRLWVAHAPVEGGELTLDVFDFPVSAVSLVRLDDLTSYLPS